MGFGRQQLQVGVRTRAVSGYGFGFGDDGDGLSIGLGFGVGTILGLGITVGLEVACRPDRALVGELSIGFGAGHPQNRLHKEWLACSAR